MRLAAVVATLSLLLIGAAVATPAAAADDYATYADVLAAKKDAAKSKALVVKIHASLDALEAKVNSANKKAEKAGNEANEADEAYQEQNVKTVALQSQADEAQAAADTAKLRAGELLVQQYRESGNTDLTVELLLNGSQSDDILYSLGMSQTLVDQAQGIFDEATQAQNTAAALGDQAKVAGDELKRLKKVADAKLAVANERAQEAAAALQEQQDNESAQKQLLAELEKKVTSTQADFQAGVAAREAARQKALAAQGGVAGVYNTAPPYVSGAWAMPEAGSITSNFGFRLTPYRGFHLGTDIGAPCGSYIYAAHAGTVSYSGWNGIYGNFIRIDVGDGVQNEYGHIISGGLLVNVGDTVAVGQHIANVGKTGGATGCHLHFGVRINGLVTDPVPFMRTYNINIGG